MTPDPDSDLSSGSLSHLASMRRRCELETWNRALSNFPSYRASYIPTKGKGYRHGRIARICIIFQPFLLLHKYLPHRQWQAFRMTQNVVQDMNCLHLSTSPNLMDSNFRLQTLGSTRSPYSIHGYMTATHNPWIVASSSCDATLPLSLPAHSLPRSKWKQCNSAPLAPAVRRCIQSVGRVNLQCSDSWSSHLKPKVRWSFWKKGVHLSWISLPNQIRNVVNFTKVPCKLS